MPGDPTQSHQQSRLTDSPAVEEWYAVTGGGASALRIAPGLVVGESDAGALALNDPEPGNQWVEFVLSENGEPWIAVVTRDKSLVADGVTCMRHQLTVGTAVQLPSNTLYISRDIRMPRTSGAVVEVVPRQVPARPQDLVGPGWEDALAAAGEPRADTPVDEPGEALDVTEPVDATETMDRTVAMDRAEAMEARAATRPARRADELAPESAVEPGVTDAEPESGRSRQRDVRSDRQRHPGRQQRADGARAQRFARPRRAERGRWAAVMLVALALGALTLAGVVAVILSVGSGDGSRLSEFEPAPLDERAAMLEPDPSAEPDAPLNDLGPAGSPGAGSVSGTGPPPETALPGTTPPTMADALPPAHDPAARERPETSDPAVLMSREPEAGSVAQDEPAAQPLPHTGVRGSPGEVALVPRLEPEAAAPLPTPEAEDPAAPMRASPPDWRLVRARELLAAGYITYPPRDNAVAYLERLLAVDPNNAEAMALLDECTRQLIQAAVRAHDQGLDYEARNTLEEVLGFNPDNERANRLWREWVDAAR